MSASHDSGWTKGATSREPRPGNYRRPLVVAHDQWSSVITRYRLTELISVIASATRTPPFWIAAFVWTSESQSEGSPYMGRGSRHEMLTARLSIGVPSPMHALCRPCMSVIVTRQFTSA